ncbi:MAG: OmpA family protein [Chitinophagales bacterium]
MQTQFRDDFKKDKWDAVIDTADLSIKFINERVLFDYAKSELKPEFQTILSQFYPKYLAIILKPQYRDKIAEVRIEGHTDNKGSYIYNVKLSQDRTRNVLQYLFDTPYYNGLDPATQQRLKFWLTANGLSSGRTLDANGNLTAFSNRPADDEKCRRVEFKIVTTSDALVREALSQMTQQ